MHMGTILKRRRFVSVIGRKSAVPDGLWMKCPGCSQVVYRGEVEEGHMVCPLCGYHHRIDARQRVSLVVDPDSFEEIGADLQTTDPLRFTVGKVSYIEKVKAAKEKCGANEALVTGLARIEGVRCVLGVMNFFFMGGSMGSVVGEKFYRAAQAAIEQKAPFVIFTASGGARMQEGILGLMQMAKTSDAIRQMNESAVPYIVVLTDPTTGGVFASFASLGDVIFAEPGAEIGFAGTRLIQGALGVKELPEGFQTAEYQLKHGFVDQIVKRSELRSILGKTVRYLSPQ